MAVVEGDPYLWLEDISGDDALDWVRKHNDPTLDELIGDRFEQMRSEALEVLDTDARIPYVRRRGEYLYNFWRDAENTRGLWRRTTLASYRTEQPEWDVILDVDALAKADDENWVWAGADVIEPEYTLALIALSRGGADAAIVREFEMQKREFVTDGFQLPEAKSGISWEDRDTVLVGTDFGPGSLTDSGYPRIVKRWRRGQPLEDAQTLFSGDPADVSVGGGYDRTPGFERLLITRSLDFFNRERYELRGNELIRIDVPTDASISIHREWLLIRPRTDQRGEPGGDPLRRGPPTRLVPRPDQPLPPFALDHLGDSGRDRRGQRAETVAVEVDGVGRQDEALAEKGELVGGVQVDGVLAAAQHPGILASDRVGEAQSAGGASQFAASAIPVARRRKLMTSGLVSAARVASTLCCQGASSTGTQTVPGQG